MYWKSVGIYDPIKHLYRLGRIIGTYGVVGDGRGFSWKVSFGFRWTFPFVYVSLRRAYGGLYV